MELTKQNYFGQDAAQQYLSASQLKRFMECEVLAMAEIRGEYKREKSPALLVGGFVDSHFSMEEKEFADNNPEIFKRDGTLKAEYTQATDIVDRILASPLLTAMMRGEVQKIVTGTIEGVPFRGKLDSLLNPWMCERIAEEYPDMANLITTVEVGGDGELIRKGTGAVVDLKCMRDFSPIYVPGAGRVSWIDAWNYPLQLAIYQQLVGGNLPCFIVGVTKEKVPDFGLFYLSQYQLDAALDTVRDLIPRYQAIKEGKVEPVGCSKCDWCKASKIITGAVDADELEGAGL